VKEEDLEETKELTINLNIVGRKEQFVFSQAWISSNDQLPDGDKDILIWSGEKVIVGGYSATDKVFLCEVAGYVATWTLDKATYWMPVPKAPEAE
jgi:hypothetical protein